jgi:glycosyltransferase involved in cell wall biosynthesis
MRWSVVMPVYNEAALLPETLGSLLRQSRRARIVVVDNGSSDASKAIVGDLAAAHDTDLLLLDEPTPGQVHALKRGIDAVASELVAICDADTVYPRDYLARAERLFDSGGERTVAACAWPAVEESGTSLASRLSAAHRLTIMRLLPWQNHVNGGSHCFRTDALRQAGSYDPARWPYVLKDHELMSRVLALGDQAGARDFFCKPSPRRTDRRAVRWTLAERLAYHGTARSRQSAFFSDWLAPRFAARGKTDTVLRQRPWQTAREAT